MVGSGLAYLLAWLPLTGIGIPCVFHLATGLYCPGCGITRAVINLLHLKLYQAFRYNPLVIILAPIYMIYWYAMRRKQLFVSKVTMAFMLAITIAFGILRNLPSWVFLAPTNLD
jgi:hypothetical protein